MSRRFALLLLVAGACVRPTLPAGSAESLQVGATAIGRFLATPVDDPQPHDYQIELGAAEPIVIDVHSNACGLEVSATAELEEEQERTDVGSGPGFDARLQWTTNVAGRWRITVRRATPCACGGEFSITVRAAVAQSVDKDTELALDRAALTKRLAAWGPEASACRAMALFAQATLEYKKGDRERGLTLGREAIDAYKTAPATDGVMLAHLYRITGYRYLRLGRIDDERAIDREALVAVEPLLPPDHLATGWAHDNLCAGFVHEKRWQEALPHCSRALAIFELRLPATGPELLRMRSLLGTTYNGLGRPRDALAQNSVAVAALRETLPAGDPERISAEQSYAYALTTLGHFDAARAIWRDLIALGGPGATDHYRELRALSLVNLGYIAGHLGDHAQALAAYREAQSIQVELHGDMHWASAAATESVAVEEWALGRLEVALQTLDGAIATYRALGKHELKRLPNALTNRSVILERLGRLEAARDSSAEALALAERDLSVGPDHHDVARARCQWANLRSRLGDLSPEVDQLFAQAIERIDAQVGAGHMFGYRCRLAHAEHKQRSGDSAGAFAQALRAEDESLRDLQLLFAGLPEKEALGAMHERGAALRLAASLSGTGPLATAGQLVALWDRVARSRGAVLDAMIQQRQRHHRDVVSPHRELTEELEHTVAEAARALLSPGNDESRRALAAALDRKAALEEELARVSGGALRASRSSNSSLQQLLGQLAPDEALVAFWRVARPKDEVGDARYLAFIRPAGGGAVRCLDLGSAGEVDRRIEAWRRQAMRGSARFANQYDATSRALAARIWDPLQTALGQPRRLYIVADSALLRVNWNGLVDTDGRYLVESDLVIQTLDTERDLIPAAPSAEPATGLVAFVAPTFDRSALPTLTASNAFRGTVATCSEMQALTFAPLPHARRELESIVSAWSARPGPSETLQSFTGALATEEQFKREAPRHRLIHLATHGYFLPASCQSGASRPENALLRAGLALAGANQRNAVRDREDGILTAEEIATLDLSHVELAVLSACDTGLGDIVDGEGVFGLRRAFRLAGAKQLVMSLWPVPDRETGQLMARLYRELNNSRHDPSLALKRASLAILRRQRAGGRPASPTCWTAFVAH